MLLLTYFVVLVYNILQSECTDIAAVYGNGVIYIKDANLFDKIVPQAADDLHLKLAHNLSYPIALSYDSRQRNLYVSDINDLKHEFFQLNLSDREQLIDIHPVVPKFGRSSVLTVEFDPVDHILLWTDAHKHGIYSTKISENTDWEPELFLNTDIHQPKGLAMDSCNRDLYWTEKFDKQRTMEKYNVNDKSINILKSARNSEYFQAIDYNSEFQELTWAETDGNDSKNSSCKIYRQSIKSELQSLVGSFENCYPFSLTTDHDFVYWSDLIQDGIMRLSKDNSSALTKLVHTPVVKSEHGGHNGAFGIVNIDRNMTELLKKSCPEVMDLKRNEDLVTLHQSHSPSKTKENSSMNMPVSSASQSLFNASLEYRRQRLMIIVLSFTSIFFLSTTMMLLSRGCFIVQLKRMKSHFVSPPMTSECPSPTRNPKSKLHRTFGPSAKTKIHEEVLTPTDGVAIEIEDCCQMTLCDTPCYTSVKKHGKGYKSRSSANSKRDDKKSLLECAVECA